MGETMFRVPCFDGLMVTDKKNENRLFKLAEVMIN